MGMTQWGLDSLFNPGKRHMDEEKRRLQSTREEVGDSSGGKRIDLSGGKVVIRKATDEDENAESPEITESGEITTADEATAESDESAAESGEPRTAAERARLRHLNRRATHKS